MSAYGDDDYQPQNYQDDLTTDDDAADPIMQEEGESPAEELNIPQEKFAEGTNELDFGDHNESDDNDDWREHVEDLEEDDDKDV